MDHRDSSARRHLNKEIPGVSGSGDEPCNAEDSSAGSNDQVDRNSLKNPAASAQPEPGEKERKTVCSTGLLFLFQHIPLPCLLVDHDGQVVDSNLAAAQLFLGFSELDGTPLVNHLQGFSTLGFSEFVDRVQRADDQMVETAIFNAVMDYRPFRLSMKEAEGYYIVCLTPLSEDAVVDGRSIQSIDKAPVNGVHPFFMFDPHGAIVNVNTNTLQVTGYTRDEITSLKASEIFYDTGFLSLPYNPDDQSQKGYYTQVRVCRDDGSRNVPVVMRMFGPLSFVVIFDDADSLLLKGAQWRKSNDYFQLLVENFTDLVVVTDAVGRYLYANSRYCELFDKQCHELMLTSVEPMIHPDDQVVVNNAFLAMTQSPGTCAYEARMLTKKGWRWISWTGHSLVSQGGKVTEFVRSGRDRTHQKEISGALAQSEMKFRGLHESLMDGFARTDLDGNILEVNHVLTDMIGYSKDELLGLNFRMITPVRWHAIEEDIFMKQVVAQGYTDVYEKEYFHKNDGVIPVELRVFLIRSSDGEPEGVWALIRDISQRKRVEQSLLLFKAIVEASSEAIAVSKPDGELVYINPAHEKLFGRTLDEAMKINFRDYYPPESVKILNEVVVPKHLKGESWEGVIDVFDANLRRFPLWERSGTLFDLFGDPEYFFGIMHDVSAQQLAEQARLENLRLETEESERTRLSRELHDHIGHLMTSVKLMLENLSLKLTEKAHKSELKEILELVQFLFKELRAITSRLTVKQPESKSLRESIDSIVDDFNRLKRMEVVSHFEFLPPKVPVEVRNNLIRILEEALTNALKHSGASRVDLRFWRSNTRLVISVKDNGRGLSEGVFSGGSGLRFMKQRAESVGGTFKISGSHPGCCEVVVEIPLGADQPTLLPEELE